MTILDPRNQWRHQHRTEWRLRVFGLRPRRALGADLVIMPRPAIRPPGDSSIRAISVFALWAQRGPAEATVARR